MSHRGVSAIYELIFTIKLTNAFSGDRHCSEAPTVIGSPGKQEKSDNVDEPMVLSSPMVDDRLPHSLSRAVSTSQTRHGSQSPVSASPTVPSSLPASLLKGEPRRKRTRVDFEEDDSGFITIKEDPDEIEVDELVEEGELGVNSTTTTPVLPSSAHLPRNKIGINHMELLYETKKQSLVCRLCTYVFYLLYSFVCMLIAPTRSRRERANAAIDPATFPLGASWTDLLGHCQQLHPASCAELEGKSPAQVAELRQRLLSKPSFDVGDTSKGNGSHTRKNSKS